MSMINERVKGRSTKELNHWIYGLKEIQQDEAI